MVNRQFLVAGFVGEGAGRMLADLKQMENVVLLKQVITNKAIRFLYYRLSRLTDDFRKGGFLKKAFYSWYALLRYPFCRETDTAVLFFNSGFCRELDLTVLKKLKAKNKGIKLILYLVDPMLSFCTPEYMRIIEEMDLVYSINRGDCEKYGFRYYPLIYSRENIEGQVEKEEKKSDLFYLGSGSDRTDFLQEVYERCKKQQIKTELHVLCKEEQEREGIIFHKHPVAYAENLRQLLLTNCILEIMHKDFDNPTQRYSEAVVYNKKLLTNNPKTVSFPFYDPKYMQVFSSIEEIDWEFVKKKENIEYGYQEEFSPRLLIGEINRQLDSMTGSAK